jgi:hypothetical protein
MKMEGDLTVRRSFNLAGATGGEGVLTRFGEPSYSLRLVKSAIAGLRSDDSESSLSCV